MAEAQSDQMLRQGNNLLTLLIDREKAAGVSKEILKVVHLLIVWCRRRAMKRERERGIEDARYHRMTRHDSKQAYWIV